MTSSAAAILDLVQPEVGPFDPPSPKTLPKDQTRSRSDDPLPRYGHFKFDDVVNDVTRYGSTIREEH